MTTTKKQWIAAYNELAETPVTSFKTASAAEEAFRGLATSLGITWTVALEGDIVLDEPSDQLTVEQADEQNVHDAVHSEEATPPAPTNDEGAEETTKGRRARETDTDVIAVLVPNPKRVGSLSFSRFAIYTTGITVAEFLAKGGRRADLKWDADHDFIRIHSAEEWVDTAEVPSETEETGSGDAPADA